MLRSSPRTSPLFLIPRPPRQRKPGPNSRRIGPAVARCHLPLWSVPPLIQVPNVKVMAISQYTQFLRCHSVLSLSVRTFLPTSCHSKFTGEPVSIMSWMISFRRLRLILHWSWHDFRMWQYLLLHMVLQEGPQQAAGVVGNLNQLNVDAANTIVAFCDAAIHVGSHFGRNRRVLGCTSKIKFQALAKKKLGKK